LELNWSTFVLEIINFLVLVWILKHFLYRPVLDALEKRRLGIAHSLQNAEQLKTEANDLEQQYQSKLNDIELEKQHAHELLQQEIQQEKTQRLNQLADEIENARQKASVIEQRQQADTINQYQKKAHQQAARFTSQLLNSLACPELEQKLLDLLLDTLKQMDESHQQALLHACKNPNSKIIVSSAYTLSQAQRDELEQMFGQLCDQPSPDINYKQDKALIAGFRIVIDAWVLNINLQDQLSGFVELQHEA
jgi:F-type H+-transporting ATPase subunit b